MDLTITVDADVIRQSAALGGITLTPARAVLHVAALHDLLTADAALAALKLNTLPAVGTLWGETTDAADRR